MLGVNRNLTQIEQIKHIKNQNKQIAHSKTSLSANLLLIIIK